MANWQRTRVSSPAGGAPTGLAIGLAPNHCATPRLCGDSPERHWVSRSLRHGDEGIRLSSVLSAPGVSGGAEHSFAYCSALTTLPLLTRSTTIAPGNELLSHGDIVFATADGTRFVRRRSSERSGPQDDRNGLEIELIRDGSDYGVDGLPAVDSDRRKPVARGICGNRVGEELIAREQVRQSALWVGRPQPKRL